MTETLGKKPFSRLNKRLTLDIKVEGHVTSGNITARQHWRERYDQSNQIDHDIFYLCRLTQTFTPLFYSAKRYVVMEYFSKRQPMDDDNLITGFKPWRDALIKAGAIYNDDADNAEFFYHQHPLKIQAEDFVRIRVYEDFTMDPVGGSPDDPDLSV